MSFSLFQWGCHSQAFMTPHLWLLSLHSINREEYYGRDLDSRWIPHRVESGLLKSIFFHRANCRAYYGWWVGAENVRWLRVDRYSWGYMGPKLIYFTY